MVLWVGGGEILRAKNRLYIMFVSRLHKYNLKLNIVRLSKMLIVSVGPLLDLDRKTQIYAATIIALTTRNGRNSGSE